MCLDMELSTKQQELEDALHQIAKFKLLLGKLEMIRSRNLADQEEAVPEAAPVRKPVSAWRNRGKHALAEDLCVARIFKTNNTIEIR